MRIIKSARKHGVKDGDILHAFRNPVTSFEARDLTMIIGAACNGSLLEIGVIDADDEDAVIVHAMPLRRSYHKYL